MESWYDMDSPAIRCYEKRFQYLWSWAKDSAEGKTIEYYKNDP